MDASDDSGVGRSAPAEAPTEATARGTARVDRKTKRLLKRLAPGEIAVISHADIDEVSARSLAAKRPTMIIDAEPCMTGRYRCPGPAILMDAGIPVLDSVGDQIMDSLATGRRSRCAQTASRRRQGGRNRAVFHARASVRRLPPLTPIAGRA